MFNNYAWNTRWVQTFSNRGRSKGNGVRLSSVRNSWGLIDKIYRFGMQIENKYIVIVLNGGFPK